MGKPLGFWRRWLGVCLWFWAAALSLAAARWWEYRLMLVTSGSMEPNISAGGLVLIKTAADYREGEVVTYRLGGTGGLVTHRVIGVKDTAEGKRWRTKGDGVSRADSQLVSREQILGKAVFYLPYLGQAVGFAKTKIGVVVLVVIPAAFIIYGQLKKVMVEISGGGRREKGKTENKK